MDGTAASMTKQDLQFSVKKLTRYGEGFSLYRPSLNMNWIWYIYSKQTLLHCEASEKCIFIGLIVAAIQANPLFQMIYQIGYWTWTWKVNVNTNGDGEEARQGHRPPSPFSSESSSTSGTAKSLTAGAFHLTVVDISCCLNLLHLSVCLSVIVSKFQMWYLGDIVNWQQFSFPTTKVRCARIC